MPIRLAELHAREHHSNDAAMTQRSHPVPHAERAGGVGSVIYLHTLGDCLIKVDEKEIRPTSPMLFAALLYLGIERGRRVPRAALQELLFPDADQRSGAHSLRQLLYKLRQLGAPIEVTATTVLVRPQDVIEDSCLLITGNGSTAVSAAIVSGVLPGFEVEGSSSDLRDWLASARAAIESRVRRVLQDSIAEKRREGRWREVESASRALLSIDPLNEHGTIALAESLALSGSKAKALQLIDNYQSEIGSSFSLVMSAARDRIIQAAVSNSSDLGGAFCGRNNDLSFLTDLLVTVRAGISQVVVVSGEAGIGKTRLVQEFETLAALDGACVEWCTCSEYGVGRSSSVLSRAVVRLLDVPGAIGVSPGTLELLKRLTETPRGNSSGTWTSAVENEALRSAVGEAVRELVEALTAEAPLVLVIEDAHWIDQSSLRSLLTLVDGQRQCPFLLIFTTRDRSLETTTSPHSRLVLHRLGPINESAAKELVSNSLGDTDDEAFVAWAVRTGGGNPFFLQTISAFFRRTGRRFEVPPTIRTLVRQSLAGVSDTAQRVLEAASLLGANSTIVRLARIAGLQMRQLVQPLRELENRGLVKQRADWIGVSHDLLVEEVRAMIPPASRTVLHALVAEVLDDEVKRLPRPTPHLLWDCAEHWRESGNNERSIELVIDCAKHLADIGELPAAYDLLVRIQKLASGTTRAGEIANSAAFVAFSAGLTSEARKQIMALKDIDPAANQSRSNGTELELLEIEIDRLSGGDCSQHVPRLLDILNDSKASRRDRLHAAFIIMIHADLTFDVVLAERSFGASIEMEPVDLVEVLFALSCKLIYHTIFGDISSAPSIIRAFDRVLEREPVALTVRYRVNCAMAALRCGLKSEAVERLTEVFTIGQSLRSEVVMLNAACHMAVVYHVYQDPADKHWVATANQIAGQYLIPNTWVLREMRCRDAIQSRDFDEARRILAQFQSTLPALGGDSGRTGVTLEGMRLRLALAESDTNVIAESSDRLLRWHHRAAARGLYDEEMEALFLGLSATDRQELAQQLLEEYLSKQRRDGFAPSPRMHALCINSLP